MTSRETKIGILRKSQYLGKFFDMFCLEALFVPYMSVFQRDTSIIMKRHHQCLITISDIKFEKLEEFLAPGSTVFLSVS